MSLIILASINSIDEARTKWAISNLSKNQLWLFNALIINQIKDKNLFDIDRFVHFTEFIKDFSEDNNISMTVLKRSRRALRFLIDNDISLDEIDAGKDIIDKIRSLVKSCNEESSSELIQQLITDASRPSKDTFRLTVKSINDLKLLSTDKHDFRLANYRDYLKTVQNDKSTSSRRSFKRLISLIMTKGAIAHEKITVIIQYYKAILIRILSSQYTKIAGILILIVVIMFENIAAHSDLDPRTMVLISKYGDWVNSGAEIAPLEERGTILDR